MRAEDVLPDDINSGEFKGMTIRKGTVAAFLANARTWLDANAAPDAVATAAARIVEALPALDALGLFEILRIADPRLRAFVEQHGAAAAAA
ncbi:MAG: hypothetical protein V4462_17560 [Pseudomonadota bacterium]